MMIKKGAQKELYGYTGKLLRIDLSSGTSRVEELDPEMLRAYIGGIGIGVRLLYDELSPGIDPLGPENKCSGQRIRGGVLQVPADRDLGRMPVRFRLRTRAQEIGL
jgi:hypothetical protein